MTDLITTHTNADFDALASMVAARRLYPGARLVLPGSQERAVREFMSLCADVVRIEHEKEASFENISRLVIVETRLGSRIGRLAQLLGRKGVEVHVYDHHPRTADDVKADRDVYANTGATTTILTEAIRKQGIRLTPLEATIMALGIYEDTGSLTFPTTTGRDIEAAGFLLSRGADLNIVSKYLKRELTDSELGLLARLIQSTEVHIINGIHVAVASVLNEDYVDDLSLLAHKIEEAENFSATFILVQTKDRVQFIARSSLPFVDVSKIAAAFGGGGHPTASGAVIRDASLPDVKAKLLECLRKHIKADIRARDIISGRTPALAVDETVSAARQKMADAGADYAVIRGTRKVEGIASIRDLDRAISRGFGHARLKGYMSGKVFPVKPGTSVYTIRDMMQQKGVGCVPVEERGSFLGLVTRTDILRAFHGRVFGGPEAEHDDARGNRGFDLAPKIRKTLPPAVSWLLKFSGRIAAEMGYKAFAVGGFVRDLLLGEENYDIDIVIEGDSIEFAKRLSKELCGTYVYHKRFGTGTVYFPCPKGISPDRAAGGKYKIDIAMTRTEVYEQPAALPTVRFGPIENDLYRRDFTINAMAFGIGREGFGRLLDPFGGRKDLVSGRIRALHDLSFVDDPTRIFRAVRFEQRYDFRIEPHTESLIKKAVGLKMVDRTQKQRIREEMIAMLSEEDPLKAVRRLSELNELRFIDAELKIGSGTARGFNSVTETLKWHGSNAASGRHHVKPWLLYMAMLLDGLDVRSVKRVCGEFALRKEDASMLAAYKSDFAKVHSALSRKGKMKPSEIYGCLHGFPQEVLLMFIAKSGSETARRRIMAYITKYSEVKLHLRGEDIKKAGIIPGPHFRDMMRRALNAKLDGVINTKAEELEFAVSRYKRH